MAGEFSPAKVILYSTTLHCWEVWSRSRPLGHGSLEACQSAYPDAMPVSEHQMRLAREDRPADLVQHQGGH